MQLVTDYRGIRTSIDPLSVPEGYLSRGENIRNDDGTISLRGGQALVDASGLTGTYKGGALFEYDGNIYYFFAIDEGGGAPDTQIYWSVYSSGSWSGPTKLTAASGQYGATEMNNPAKGFITFTGVPGLYGTKYVLVQNGVDDPRVITISASPTIAINQAITAPQELSNNTPTWTAADYLNIMDTSGGAVTVTVVSGSGLSGTATGTPQYWRFSSSGSGVADGDIVQIRLTTSTLDCSKSNQLWVIAESDDDAFLYGFKWSIGDSSGNLFVIHDPENGRDNVTRIPLSNSGQFLLAFPIGEHTRTATLNAIDRIRLEAQNTAVGVSQNIDIKAILASGRVPGTSQYAVSWSNDGTRAESPSVVLRNPFEGDGLAGIFGSALPDLDSDFKLPISPALDYVVKVPMLAPSTTLRDLGVDYVNIYRKDPGEDDFYYVGEDQCSVYSASTWSYQSPFTASALRQLYTDEVYTWAKDVTKSAPGAYVESVPKGISGAYSGDRMYVGSVGTATEKPTVWVSDKAFPFRFRAVPISGFSQDAGYSAVLDGEQQVTAIVPGSGSVVGGGFVYVFTDKGCYTVADYLVAKVSTTGCIGNGAWAIEDGRLWFVDQDKQVRVMGGGIDNLSRYTVDDIFEGVTSPDLISLARFRGRLYCRTGANEVMVWSDRLRDWESKDTPEHDVNQFLRWDFLGEAKLYCGGENANLLQYETGNLDIAAQIALGISWKEYRDMDWGQFKMGEPYIVCTDKDSESGTFTFIAKNPASTKTGTISLDAGSGETVTWAKGADSGKDVAVRGCAVLPKFDCTIQGPFKLYGVKVVSNGNYGRGAKSQ